MALQGNCIFEINDALGKIEALRYLYLQNNRIKKLKPSLKNLRLMGFMIYGNGMNYDEPMNKDVLEYIRSTYCSVHTEEFLMSRGWKREIQKANLVENLKMLNKPGQYSLNDDDFFNFMCILFVFFEFSFPRSINK